MPKPLLKKATIYPQKHRSGNRTWVVNVGRKINGKSDLRRFKNEQDAEAFKNEWNLKLAENNTADLLRANSPDLAGSTSSRQIRGLFGLVVSRPGGTRPRDWVGLKNDMSDTEPS